jgi:hypothetical protein
LGRDSNLKVSYGAIDGYQESLDLKAIIPEIRIGSWEYRADREAAYDQIMRSFHQLEDGNLVSVATRVKQKRSECRQKSNRICH